MKKVMFISISVILLVITIFGTPVFAAKPDVPPQGPFNELWDALNSLQQQIEAVLAELLGQIEAEVTARIDADQGVASAAQAANDALQNLLETAIASGDAATASAAQAANDALQNLLETDIAAEEDARIAADNNLQSQIGNSETPILGAWESRAPYIEYDADTYGFVVASIDGKYYGGSCNTLWVEVWDPEGAPHKIVEHGELGDLLSITVPVPKGYSWRVQTGDFPVCELEMTIYWVSLGN